MKLKRLKNYIKKKKKHLKDKYLNKYIKAFGRYLYVTNVINKTDVNCLEIYYDEECNSFSIDNESGWTLYDAYVKIITKEEFMQYMNDCISKATQCLK